MSPLLTLGLWLALTAGSVVAHELAHVLAGVKLGWSYEGVLFKPLSLAVGVKLEPNGNEREVWKIAAAGPITTACLAALFFALPGELAHSLAWLNLSILAINILPVWKLDGALVLRGLRERAA